MHKKKMRWTFGVFLFVLLSGVCLLRSGGARIFATAAGYGMRATISRMPCGVASVTFFFQCGSCPYPVGSPPYCGEGNADEWDTSSCSWTCVPTGNSPVLIDVDGQGFLLTNAANGVLFDIRGTGNPMQIAWTAVGADDAFLALPGSDGLVHNGKQLFGNFTPQPPSQHPNGFAALAVYDQPANGGNGDGIIDARDKIFSSLRLWIDANHDGICQPSELLTLPAKGIDSISLKYAASMRRDQYGNLFRYRSRVNPDGQPDNSDVGRTAYDVFLTVAR